jgi:hypothetical protein
MDPTVFSALASGVSAFAALSAIVVSVIVYKGQSVLTKAQSKLSKEIHEEQSKLSLKIHENQILLSQRQLLIPLWEYISKVDRIDPSLPVTPDVLKVVNTLELVALCTEGGMVDTQVIKRTFGQVFLELYDQVHACPPLPGLNKSGPDLLRENRAAMSFYKELSSDDMNRDKLANKIS